MKKGDAPKGLPHSCTSELVIRFVGEALNNASPAILHCSHPVNVRAIIIKSIIGML
jgi:hypothetical protein